MPVHHSQTINNSPINTNEVLHTTLYYKTKSSFKIGNPNGNELLINYPTTINKN